MKRQYRIGWIMLAIGLLALRAFGDYLETQRSATIKAGPNTQAGVIERVEKGTLLPLLDEGTQTDGYYHVRLVAQGQDGWIYRTFVRRSPGELPRPEEKSRPANPLEDPTSTITEAQKSAAARYLRLGKPQSVYERVREGYVLAQDARLKIPLWVQYELTRDDLSGTATRTDRFQADTSIPYGSRAERSDYEGSGYDQGHMAPAADMIRSKNAIDESFLLSNVAPQVGIGFNRQIWQELESAIRGWVEQRGSLVIIAGPVFGATDGRVSYKVIGKDNVAVPTHFYKIVIDANNQNDIRTLAFLMPNEDLSGHKIGEYLVSVDELENLTGLDFLSALPLTTQEAVESKKAVSIW
jgi:endonuclease G